MKCFFVLLIYISLSQSPHSLAEQTTAGKKLHAQPVDIGLLAARAARGEPQALAALIERAKRGDSKAQHALSAIESKQAPISGAKASVDIQTLALSAANGDPAAKQTLVAMATQGSSLARTVLEAIAANQKAAAIPEPRVAGNTSVISSSAASGSSAPSSEMLFSSMVSPAIDPWVLSLLPPGVMASVKQMAMLEKDPNLDDEFQHILYWMGEKRRCHVTQNNRRVSVLGVMVMLDKAYQQFKPVLPNLESLLMLAAAPRNTNDENASAPMILHCLKQKPVNLVDWVIPEIHRYRARRR